MAQSAADKATARQLATEGIKLFRSGKYAEALDKVQRAETLYDAPVHLLYIARCQVKLGKLVEGAETYRHLARVQLQPGAPPAFKDAQDSGATELSQLEPRIPSLKLEIEPANVDGLKITIDGEQVPSAVLGVDRPANPGSHDIQVSAPGYAAAQQTVQLGEHENKPVQIKLQASAGAAPVVAPPPGPAPSGTPPPSNPPPADTSKGEPAPTPAKVGFMVGLRLGVTVPGGDLLKGTNASVAMSDYAKPGGGGEIHGGIRFAKYFTPVLFVGASVLKPGSYFDNISATPGTNVTTTITSTSGGIGLMVGTPRGKPGFFGELDWVPLSLISAKSEISPLSCSATETLSGNALRLAGGGVIPIANLLHLTPMLGVEFGSYTSDKLDESGAGCVVLQSQGLLLPAGERSIPSDNQATHTLVFVGLGGDFVFGNDKPAK